MARKVIVFEELVTRLPSLEKLLADSGNEVTYVAGGRDAMLALNTGDICAVILDVAMPQMSGVECCRQIKEGGFAPSAKILLITSIESPAIAQRAADAGCDQFFHEKEASEKVGPYLNQVFSSGTNVPPPPSEKRSVPRVDVQGRVQYWIDGKESNGELINGSKTGLLFATAEALPKGTSAQLRLFRTDGTSCDFNVSIVRTVDLDPPQNGLKYGAAGKFGELSPEQQGALEEILSSSMIRSKKAPKLDPALVQKILSSGVELILPLVRGEVSDERLTYLMDTLRPYEQEAFTQEGGAADCVRRLVLMRLQCNAFRVFIPTLKNERGLLSHSFLPILSNLVQRTDAVELEVEELVRQAVASANEAQRQGLNEISNRLYEAKIKLFLAIDAQLSPEGLGPEASVIVEIKKRVEQQKLFQKGVAVDLKYDRRAPPPPPPKEEKKPKSRPLFKQLWFQITLGFSVLLFVGSGVWYYMSTHVSKNELPLTLSVENVVINEEGLLIYCTLSNWKNVPKDELTGVFEKVEKYMSDRRLAQAKFLDENEHVLAIIASARLGQKRIYSRRIKVYPN